MRQSGRIFFQKPQLTSLQVHKCNAYHLQHSRSQAGTFEELRLLGSWHLLKRQCILLLLRAAAGPWVLPAHLSPHLLTRPHPKPAATLGTHLSRTRFHRRQKSPRHLQLPFSLVREPESKFHSRGRTPPPTSAPPGSSPAHPTAAEPPPQHLRAPPPPGAPPSRSPPQGRPPHPHQGHPARSDARKAPNPHGSHPRPPRAVLPGIRPLPPPPSPPPRAARGPPHRPRRSGPHLPPLPCSPPPAPGPRRGPAAPGSPHPGPRRLLCCCRRPAAEHGRSGSSGPSSGRLLPLPASLTAAPGLGRSGEGPREGLASGPDPSA